MQARQLRRILQQIVLAGLPVAAGGCVDIVNGNDCVEQKRRTLYLETPADPPLQFRIDRCRADIDTCQELCVTAMERAQLPASPSGCEVAFNDGLVTVKVEYEVYHGGRGCPVDGRRPAGLTMPRHIPADSAIGAWLAQAAWLEAASVHAFVHLARELQGHGAPPALIRAAIAAARDEVRHTELMTYLAKRYGGEPPPVEVAAPAARSLEALAIENAAEGCVRETWGAVLALWQARAARDRELREAFVIIAKDEVRHAALAWAVDQWVRPQLADAARARVDAAREAAARELGEGSDLGALGVLGLPDPGQARGLLARTHASLWMGGHS